MDKCRLLLFFAAISSIFRLLRATSGDADPIYIECVGHCKETGCVGRKCFHHCNFSSGEKPIDGPWYMQEPLYLRWKQWDCLSDCQYHCMLSREEERQKLGLKPIKYHGKWPFRRVYGIQTRNLFLWHSLPLTLLYNSMDGFPFFILVNYKLPFSPKKKPYYEYTGLWHIYAILSMNSWIWSAVSHSRDVELTEKLDYSSVVAFIGYSLLVAILRAFNVRDAASRVMIAAPIVAFVTTHILYLNFYQLDHGLNTKVSVAMTMVQFILWAVWAGFTHHPSRRKLWLVAAGGILSMLIKIYGFPPYMGYVDADALWHALSIPLTYLWWSFVRDDSEFGTATLVKKAK